MKISILTPAFFQDAKELGGEDTIIFGGAERMTVDFVHFLQSRGHTVTCFQYINNVRDGKLINCGQLSKVYDGIQFILMPDTRWEYNTNPLLNMKFNECFVGNYDLAIYWTTYMAYPYAVNPSIAICHGIYWDYPYSDAMAGDESYRKEFMKRQLQGFANPDAVVSVDSNTKRVISAIQPGLERSMEVIYNYVDTEKFKPLENKPVNERLKVLFPRRLTLLRGCNEFIRASRECPEYDFLAVGQGANQEAYDKQQAWGETTSNLRFIWKPMEGMEEIYQQSDIAVIPTKNCEGLSLSLLESMACGLPTISTHAGGLTDATIDGYNTIIFNPVDNNLAELIRFLADNPDAREVMGKRNRDIACDCFDIEIWKQRWSNLLRQFGASMTPIPGWSLKKLKPKLVAMMPVKNESDRYLERVIENTLLFCDQICILDDHSIDDTMKTVGILQKKYPDRILFTHAESSWESESELRTELIEFALKESNPDWLIAVDADELYESGMIEEVQKIMAQDRFDVVGFRFYDMWNDEEHYRDDDLFPAACVYGPRMFRVKKGMTYEFSGNRHCGSIPQNLTFEECFKSAIRVKHLGYIKQEDRKVKYINKTADDPTFKHYSKEVYEAILNNKPPVVKWDDNNRWQAGAGKFIIAYPPGMEWDIMQQRPHHLLKLAASERNRVFFGDDYAPGTYEPIPYLTVVKDWEGVKEVDVLYITSPAQMERCAHIKYKKLIYDCCDWQNGADFEMIEKADYVLCASKLLHEEVASIKSPHYEKVIYLPNACDFGHFFKASEMHPNAQDIVGYMGCIHPIMIDETLVKALADNFNLLFIGQNKGAILDNPNIYSVGHIDYENLPPLLAQCKVGIIPFRTDSDYLKYSAPIKVYEYLAAGRPVVATPIPELIPLAEQGLIRIVDGDDHDGWIKALEHAMTEYPNNKGQEWAKAQVWSNRWETIKKEVLSNER